MPSLEMMPRNDDNHNRNKWFLLFCRCVLFQNSQRRSSNNNNSTGNKIMKQKAGNVLWMRDDDNSCDTSSVLTLMGLPVTLRIYILNFLGETQEELRTLTVISKAINKDCKRPGIEWKLIPVFVISPSPAQSEQKLQENSIGRTKRLLQNLGQHQRDVHTNNQFQQYQYMVVNHIDNFNELGHYVEVERMTENIRFEGVKSLNISLLSQTRLRLWDSLPRALSCMVPNLCELDISNTTFNHSILACFIERCPHLEKITGNNMGYSKWRYITTSGEEMKSATNLRELIMDNPIFCSLDAIEMSDLNNHHDIFLFHQCGSKVLERLSIRNAKYAFEEDVTIPQNVLIKFVRNAPSSLRWFRSDLSQENMDMLQLERLNIELVN